MDFLLGRVWRVHRRQDLRHGRRQCTRVFRFYAGGMVLFGITGSEVGGWINQGLDDRAATHLFAGAMVMILGINGCNIVRFLF